MKGFNSYTPLTGAQILTRVALVLAAVAFISLADLVKPDRRPETRAERVARCTETHENKRWAAEITDNCINSPTSRTHWVAN